MAMVDFEVDGNMRSGYLALPAAGRGPGVLVLHAWWGLTSFIKSVCNRLAEQGFVAFAPDVHHGKLAKTIEEAEHLLETRDEAAAEATAKAGLRFLQQHPAVEDGKLGALGFSMGAMFALMLDEYDPQAFGRVVLFYGGAGADFSNSNARFQCHFGELDEWDPIEYVRQMNGIHAEIHIYPQSGHWFFEIDRSDHFNPGDAELAWKRTLEFLGKPLAA